MIEVTIGGLDVVVHNYTTPTEWKNSCGALGGYGDCAPGDPGELSFDVYDEDGELLFNQDNRFVDRIFVRDLEYAIEEYRREDV